MVVFLNGADIWQKVGFTGFTIIAGFIWVGTSYAFLINNDKCANCGISIKDDYRYCSRCDLQKETELRNTTEPLHCIVSDCDERIESVDDEIREILIVVDGIKDAEIVFAWILGKH